MDNEPSKNHIPNLPLSLLSLQLGGITSPEKTADGYELRSRGPASRGFDLLDSWCGWTFHATSAIKRTHGAGNGRDISVEQWHICSTGACQIWVNYQEFSCYSRANVLQIEQEQKMCLAVAWKMVTPETREKMPRKTFHFIFSECIIFLGVVTSLWEMF
jgi:hypothetical protein